MSTRDEEFLKKLQAAFAIEASEHAEAMATGLLAIEQGGGDASGKGAADPQPVVETIYREAHSLKGAARAVNRLDIEAVCQALETVFAAWKRRDIQSSPGIFDHLHGAVDLISQMLASSGEEKELGDQIAPLAQQLSRIAAGAVPAPRVSRTEPQAPSTAPGEPPVTASVATPAPASPAPASSSSASSAPASPPSASSVVPASSQTAPSAAAAESSSALADHNAASNGVSPNRTSNGSPSNGLVTNAAALHGVTSKNGPASNGQTSHPASNGTNPRGHGVAKPANGVASLSPPASPSALIRPSGPDGAPLPETVRIATLKLDSLLLQAEEMLAAKLTAGQRAADLRALSLLLERWRKEWGKVSLDARAVRQWLSVEEKTRSKTSPKTALVETALPTAATAAAMPMAMPSPGQIASLLEFLDWNEDYFRSLESRVTHLSRAAERDGRAVGTMVDLLLADTKKLLMLPFATLLGLFPRLVRDLSRDQNKDVLFSMHGGEVEIDKRILEEMKDPLIHLLRNGVDHGIEVPEERARRGKPSRAMISVDVVQSGDKVEIIITDDGAGIDAERVKAAAVKKGVLSQEEAARLSHEEAVFLVFAPDVSTKAIITEISGRGLGMCIVREKVEALGGRIQIDTELGRGTTFRIVLPLTLATFEGVLVQSQGQTFVVPTAGIECVARVRKEDVRTVESRETILVKDKVTPLVSLANVLELEAPVSSGKDDEESASNFLTVMVLALGEGRIAFAVDAIINEQEVLVKPLGKPLVRVRNVSGATILGSGKALPVLNVADLLQSAVKAGALRHTLSAAPSSAQKGEDGGPTPQRPAVLIAEDSITSRLLLKSILESAGYEVTTAVDGADALEALQTGDFALVCSDVDMPRMNGFDLTTKIRADARLAELPVVLVTSRESPEDRERGADAGANAYVIKSGFDQSRLLEIVRRLV